MWLSVKIQTFFQYLTFETNFLENENLYRFLVLATKIENIISIQNCFVSDLEPDVLRVKLNFRRREKFPKSNKHKEGGDGVQILGILWELNNWMPCLE